MIRCTIQLYNCVHSPVNVLRIKLFYQVWDENAERSGIAIHVHNRCEYVSFGVNSNYYWNSWSDKGVYNWCEDLWWLPVHPLKVTGSNPSFVNIDDPLTFIEQFEHEFGELHTQNKTSIIVCTFWYSKSFWELHTKTISKDILYPQ